jgi:hypothetical protein
VWKKAEFENMGRKEWPEIGKKRKRDRRWGGRK